MKNRILMSVCMISCMQVVMAQNTVENIRQRYAAVKEYISTHNEDNQYDGATYGEFYHLEARQFLPGTGGHKENIFFYWDEREEEKIYPSHYLKFATTSYNYSAMSYYQEYLYDKDGKVAFIYVREPYLSLKDGDDPMDFEFRFYLNKGKLHKIIVKRSDIDQNNYKEIYSGNTMKQEFMDTYNQYSEKANKIRNLFINIEKVTYDYSE